MARYGGEDEGSVALKHELMSTDTWTQDTYTESDAAPVMRRALQVGLDPKLLPMSPEDSLGGNHHANSKDPGGHGPAHAPASTV